MLKNGYSAEQLPEILLGMYGELQTHRKTNEVQSKEIEELRKQKSYIKNTLIAELQKQTKSDNKTLQKHENLINTTTHQRDNEIDRRNELVNRIDERFNELEAAVDQQRNNIIRQDAAIQQHTTTISNLASMDKVQWKHIFANEVAIEEAKDDEEQNREQIKCLIDRRSKEGL